LCFPAFAGYYSAPVYSGGNISPAIPPGSPTDYRLNSNGYWGRDIGLGGTVSATGTITAVFTWIPDPGNPLEPPPKDVIVHEYCLASAGAMSQPGSASASADNGLGSPSDSSTTPITIVSGGQTIVLGQSAGSSSVGSKYTKKDGGYTITLTCSPSATATGGRNSSASVLYKATVSPVTVTLGGGIGTAGDKQYVIGQLCTASVTAGGLAPVSYSWSVSGGEPFKSYNANESTAVFTPLGAMIQSSAQFYWKKPDDATVTCNVLLVTPDGTIISATAEAECGVVSPDYTLTSPSIGTVQALPRDKPSYMKLTGVRFTDTDNVTKITGILWVASVTDPTGFNGGGWNFTQIVSLDGAWALDTWFPYEPRGSAFPANGTIKKSGDSPSDPFAGTYVSVRYNFKVYTLYVPSGGCYVPLKNILWSWYGTATLSGEDWTIVESGTDKSTGDDFPSHPVWTKNAAAEYYPL